MDDDGSLDRYRERGFGVARGVFGAREIGAVVDAMTSVVRRSPRLFPRQSTLPRWQTHTFDAHGHIVHSMLDVHDDRTSDPWRALPRVSYAARELLCSRALQEVLARADGHASHRLIQSMLFEANTATAPHHDGYYLDGDPEGAIVGAWIALEDIHEDAGRFFVATCRDRARDVVGDAERADHATYLARCKSLFDARRSEIVVPALAKGDVVVWSSATLHGAMPTRDPRRTRRSLNGHFLPEGARLGSWLQPRAETSAMTFHRHGDVLWSARHHVAPTPTLAQIGRGLLASARGLRAP